MFFVGGIGQQQGQQDSRPDVEARDAQHHRVDRARHDLCRFGCFPGRDAHQFDCGVGEYHPRGDQHYGQQTGWHDASMAAPQGDPGLLAVDLVAPSEKDRTDDQKRNQRDHLDQ